MKNREQDICAGRHRGNPESIRAFEGLLDSLPERRRRVLRAIADQGENGLTCRELAARWDVPMHQISGRLTELKASGLIRKNGVRERSAVMVAAF